MIKKILFNSIKRNFILYLILVISIASIVVFSLLPATMLKRLIDEYFNQAIRDDNILRDCIVAYVLFLMLEQLAKFIEKVILVYLGQDFSKEIRHEMALKLLRIEGIYFSYNETGITSSKFINDVDAINTIFTSGIISIAIDLFKIIGIVIMMFIFNIYLGIATLILLPLIYLLTRLFKRFIFKAQLKQRKEIAKINNHISETFTNEQMIKLYNKEEYMKNKNSYHTNENYKAQRVVTYSDSIFSPIIKVITAILICTIVLISNPENNILGLSLGMISAAIEYIKNLFGPIEELGMELQTIQKSLSGLKRVNEFFDEKEEDLKEKIDLDEFLLKKEIEFNNLTFSYDTRNILSNINISLEGEKKYSFIGRTGVGKTTTFRLIEGVLKPTQGKILLNGIDVRKIPNEYKYKIFGYVEQKFSSIEGTILENITLRNKNITIDMVNYALKLVGLYDKIKTFENGINEAYNDSLFSNGEKELLSIARAIAPSPIILLLDEITANLDSITMKNVMESLNKASCGKMILEITHRLSSTKNSNLIIELENGKISDIFTPNELKDNPKYKTRLLLEEY